MIPFDGAFAAQLAAGLHRQRAGRAARRRAASASARTSASATARKGDAALLRAQDAFETRVVELVEVDGEIVSSIAHPRADRGRRGRARERASSARRSSCAATVAHGDKRGRSLGFPTANLVPDPALVCPGHGVYACRAAVEVDGELALVAGRDERRRAADVRDRPRGAGRGVPARLRRRPLRARAAARIPAAAARRAALRLGRGAGRADGTATSRTHARLSRRDWLLPWLAAHDA